MSVLHHPHNIYILYFIRETLSKRKLTTKVLLPNSLEIPSSATMKQNEQLTYILCSVQNHLGTSAHGGHYVADVVSLAGFFVVFLFITVMYETQLTLYSSLDGLDNWCLVRIQ